MSSKEAKIRRESQLSRRNCQIFSGGLSPGACPIWGQRDLGRHDEPVRQMPAGQADKKGGVRAWGDVAAISAWWRLIVIVLQRGITM